VQIADFDAVTEFSLYRKHRSRDPFDPDVEVREAGWHVARRTMISCSEAVKQLWEYLDGTVEEADRALLEEHISRCRRCCGELEFARELRRVLTMSAYVDLPTDVLRRLNQTLQELNP
jgi:anti-sigma factor (TIGR02949 family)